LSCVNQNVFIVEYRHITGMCFGDDKKETPVLEEMRVIKEIVDEIKL
jgi:hypothetical protein